jgi:hypothetical protein
MINANLKRVKMRCHRNYQSTCKISQSQINLKIKYSMLIVEKILKNFKIKEMK